MRHRIWSAALAAAALIMAAAQPAHASDNYPVRDGTGASQTFCSKLVGGLQYPCHLIYGMFGSTPTPVTTDGTNLNVHVQASELPTGAATATNQATANTSLTSLNTVLGTQADTTWAGSGSGTVIALQKYIATKIEATRALLAGTLTVNLPAGASTSAKQDTANTSLGSIDTKTPALGQTTKSASTPVTVASDQFQATSTPAGVTITTALTFQSVLASSGTRKGCLIQNTSSDVEYVFFGANGSATAAASLQLQPGQTLSCAANQIILTDNVSMTSATTNGATAVVVSQ